MNISLNISDDNKHDLENQKSRNKRTLSIDENEPPDEIPILKKPKIVLQQESEGFALFTSIFFAFAFPESQHMILNRT
jgi:hypothetical protein